MLSFRVTIKLVWVLALSGALVTANNGNSRPAVVNIGAMFSFNSTIGRVAKIAMKAAVDDVNSNSSVLKGTKLVLKMQDSNCHGFFGIIEGTLFLYFQL